jgi:hypothetical protein
MAASLDGFIARKDGSVDWLEEDSVATMCQDMLSAPMAPWAYPTERQMHNSVNRSDFLLAAGGPAVAMACRGG